MLAALDEFRTSRCLISAAMAELTTLGCCFLFWFRGGIVIRDFARFMKIVFLFVAKCSGTGTAAQFSF